MTEISLQVNGARVAASVEPRLHLADFLREQQLLTGTHIGCEHGVCGACTLLLDGRPVRSCITLAAACDGRSVRTIEGLEEDAVTARLRAAFTAEHALQCGYCTPGMLVTARDIVMRLPHADEARIRLELSGNLCRCTGYAGIVRAIRRVLAEGVTPPPETSAAPPAPKPLSHLVASAAATTATPSSSAPAAAIDGSGPSLRQRMRLAVPRARVWAALKDPQLIAACIPGAELSPGSTAQRVEGRMTIAFGPVRARFAGRAEINYDDAAWAGSIEGEGSDGATGTRLSARARFHAAADGADATDLALTIDYGLRGPLAQFNRPALTQAFAAEIARRFASALEARLSGRSAGESMPARLDAGRLLLSILWRRLRRMLTGK